jgi:hypothetical protein
MDRDTDRDTDSDTDRDTDRVTNRDTDRAQTGTKTWTGRGAGTIHGGVKGHRQVEPISKTNLGKPRAEENNKSTKFEIYLGIVIGGHR